MRSRTLAVAILSVSIFAVLLMLRAVGSLPRSLVTPKHVSPGAFEPTPGEPEPTRETDLKEGLALVESHCSQCHTARWLAQIEKTRAEWEKTLAQMEQMGVRLAESEKLVLLNYLAVVEEP